MHPVTDPPPPPTPPPTHPILAAQITFVELYNDRIRDLLAEENQPSRRRRRLVSDTTTKIDIRENTATREVFLTGSATLNTSVTSSRQVLEVGGTKKSGEGEGKVSARFDSPLA